MINIFSTKVAIEPVYESNKTPSGLLIKPDIAKQRVNQGIVKYIGSKVTNIQVGDYVLFSGYSGSLIYLQDEGRIIILDEDFIVARIDPPDNIKNTNIPGLFFFSKSDGYFPATYEIAMTLITDMISETEFRRTFKSNLSDIDNRESLKKGYNYEKDR